MMNLNCDIDKYEFFNMPTGKKIKLQAYSKELLPPFFLMTDFLIKNMEIQPDESVLDLRAETGLIGLSAKLLGAARVTFVNHGAETISLVKRNIVNNFEDEHNFRVIQSDFFKSLDCTKFDHIISNLTSVPSPPDLKLPNFDQSGMDGREFHDTVQNCAKYYLKKGGRLTFVHSSLCNLNMSLDILEKNGFSYKISEPFEHPFQDFYPVDHLVALAGENKVVFDRRDGTFYEKWYVIFATLKENKLPRALKYLEQKGLNYRLLPHGREAMAVELAVKERDVKIEEMIKCIFLKDAKEQFVLACATGDTKLNIQRIRSYVPNYSRLSFASPDEISSILGYELGSVAPIDLKEEIPVILDNKIMENKRVNISSGDPRLGLELETEDLLSCLTDPIFGDITTGE
jgi:Cys-tRNA(Pro)/Cys-tRNA(Cys) deacylase